MLDSEFISLLACPVTQQTLRLALPEELEALNAAIEARFVKTVERVVAETTLEAALIREDARVAYPVRDGIVVLLASEGLGLISEPVESHS